MIVKIRGILLQYVDYRSQIEVGGETVRGGLQELTERYPRLNEVLMDRGGVVRSTHLVALNGERLHDTELDREATEEDRVDIVTAVSGG